jgi:hypothetical protein
MRVFVSSTVYDLIDTRAEIADLLRSIGISPVLSDDKLSDFHVTHSANSIETCLINVASSDEIVIILDQRYGPRLGMCGFDDISATHLEYRHAVALRKPIHMYVRDRLEADHQIWKKNRKDESLQLSWIRDAHDYGLFALMDEHTKLSARRATSNWYRPFTSSIDLVASLRKQLELRILPERVVDSINKNEFPLFDITQETTSSIVDNYQVLTFKCTLTNVGGAPAFDCRVYWDDKNEEVAELNQRSIVTPGGTVKMTFVFTLGNGHLGTKKQLIVEYSSAIGVFVVDRFEVGGRVRPGPQPMIWAGASLVKRKFLHGAEVRIAIEQLRG